MPSRNNFRSVLGIRLVNRRKRMQVKGMRMHAKIQNLAESKRFNQSQLAEAASRILEEMGLKGISITSMNRFWHGVRVPDAQEALGIARALDVSLDYLVDESIDAQAEAIDPDLARVIANARDVGFAEANRRILNPAPVGKGWKSSAELDRYRAERAGEDVGSSRRSG